MQLVCQQEELQNKITGPLLFQNFLKKLSMKYYDPLLLFSMQKVYRPPGIFFHYVVSMNAKICLKFSSGKSTKRIIILYSVLVRKILTRNILEFTSFLTLITLVKQFFFVCVLGQGFTMQFRLALKSLCNPHCPQIGSDPPASAP